MNMAETSQKGGHRSIRNLAGSTSKMHSALLVVEWVSLAILRNGSQHPEPASVDKGAV